MGMKTAAGSMLPVALSFAPFRDQHALQQGSVGLGVPVALDAVVAGIGIAQRDWSVRQRDVADGKRRGDGSSGRRLRRCASNRR